MYKIACFLIVALFGVVHCVPSTLDTINHWVPGNLSDRVPSNALIGGVDQNGFRLYVGRFKYSGTVLPARVIAETGVAAANTDTTPVTSRTYDLLTTQDNMNYEWVRSFDGFYEENSVSVGTSVWDERVFLCRVKKEGGLLVGTLFLTKKVCFVQGLLYMIASEKYEVLVAYPKVNGAFY